MSEEPSIEVEVTEWTWIKRTARGHSQARRGGIKDALDHEVERLEAMELAANSQRTVGVGERRFQKFLDEQGLELDRRGISDDDLRRYMAHLKMTGIKKYPTLKTYLSMGVRRYHEERDFKFQPIKDRPRVLAVRNGLRRLMGEENPSRPVLPITAEMLIRMRATFDLSNSMDLCIFAAIELGFFCLLRKSNIANKTLTDKPSKNGAKFDAGVPKRASIGCDAKGAMWLTLTNTKTIQFGERTLLLPIPEIPGDPLCPRAMLTTYMATTAHRGPDDPVFGYYTAAKVPRWNRLTHSVLVKRLKKALTDIGEDPTRYAGHSLRRGGATFAFGEAGLHEITIKALGDWISTAFLRYCEVQTSIRAAGARAMGLALLAVRTRTMAMEPTT
jgi:hypothetical protein